MGIEGLYYPDGIYPEGVYPDGAPSTVKRQQIINALDLKLKAITANTYCWRGTPLRNDGTPMPASIEYRDTIETIESLTWGLRLHQLSVPVTVLAIGYPASSTVSQIISALGADLTLGGLCEDITIGGPFEIEVIHEANRFSGVQTPLMIEYTSEVPAPGVYADQSDPADPVHERIIANLDVRLKAIKIVNGYRTDAGLHVFHWQAAPLSEADMDCIEYREKSIPIEDGIGEWVHQVEIEIKAFTPGSNADDRARNLLSDILLCLDADPAWSSLAEDTMIRTIDKDLDIIYGERKWSGVMMKISVLYVTDRFAMQT